MIDLEQRIQECGCGGGGGAPAARHTAKAKQVDAELNRELLADEVMVQWTNPTKGNAIAWGKGGTRRYLANLTGPFPMHRVDAEGRFKGRVKIIDISEVPAVVEEEFAKMNIEVVAEGK